MNLEGKRYGDKISLESYLKQSKQLREADRPLAEIELLTEAIAFFPYAEKLYLSLGIACDRVQDIDGVINNYQKAILIDRRQAFWVYTTIVERLQWQNRLEAAVDFSNQGIELYPQQSELYRQRAIVRAKQGDVAAAIADYLTAIELDVNQPLSLYSHLLKLLNQEQKFERFHFVYDRLIDLYPEHNDAEIYLCLGNYFEVKRSLRQALDAYYKCLTINPNREDIKHKVSSLHFNLGVDLLSRKNIAAAVKQFQRVESIEERYQHQLNWLYQNKSPWTQTKWQLKKTFNSLLPQGKKWPTITVVTPSFNQAEYIEETILSVIDREYDNLEYIVVDGLSSDRTGDILQQYHEQIDRIIIEPDRGQSDAINKGFNLGTGELMMWLNSDDMLFPGALYMLALTYLNQKCDLIAGICAVHRDSNIIAARKPKVRQQDFNVANLGNILHFWAKGHFFFQPETIFTRQLWQKVGGKLNTDLHYAMDHELWLRFANANAKLEVIDYPIALFRKHEGQKTADSLASLSELTKVVEPYSPQISPDRTAIVTQKLSVFYQLSQPKIAIVYQEINDFSQQIEVELKTAFPKQEYYLFDWEAVKQISLNNFNLLILVVTSQTDTSVISWFNKIKYQGISVGWLWTRENDHYLNSLIVDTVDICIPKNKLLGRVVKNTHSFVFSSINICSLQWSKKQAEKVFDAIINNRLTGNNLNQAVVSEKDAKAVLRPKNTEVFWLDENYYKLTLEEKIARLSRHKVCVFAPKIQKNENYLAIFEALLCGLITIVASRISDIDELFSSADRKYLSLLFLNDGNHKQLSEAIEKAIFLFDRQGIAGRKKRHSFILNNHLLTNRLNSFFARLPILASPTQLLKDNLNQSMKIDTIQNQLEVKANQTQPLSYYLEEAQNLLDVMPEKAKDLCKKAIELYPDSSAGYRQLGVTQEKQGDITGQITSYTKAIALESNQPFWVYSVSIDRLQTTGQFNQALEIARQGIELYPEEAELYRNLGVVLDRLGDTGNVIKNYFKAISLNPQQPFWAYCALAEHLCWQGRVDEAEEVTRQGIKIYPQKPDLLRYLGLALQKQGKPKEAINAYLQAIQNGLSQPKAVYESLITLYRESNNLNKAIDICKQAIEVLPDAERSEFVTRIRDLTFLSADRLPTPTHTANKPATQPKSEQNTTTSAATGNNNNVCTNLSNTEYVRYIYKTLLKREIDPKGLKSNLKALDNGVARTLLLENILNSAEFASLGSQQVLEDLSDKQFLTILWELLLGRGCDPNAEQTYLNHLAKGLSRSQLMLEILKTEEFRKRVKNLGLLNEEIARNTGSVWIMGTEDFITQSEWDRRLLDVLCDRLSNQKDVFFEPTPRTCSSEIVKSYLARNATPIVSVITSLFKGGKYIKHFLENMTTQTIFEAIELIIIDANSPENEFEVIEPYLAEFDNIRYIRTAKTIGIYEAWNVGVVESKGEFLTNANLDDLRRFDCLEKQAEALILNPDADLVYQDIFYSLTANLPFATIEECGYKTKLPDIATKEVMLEFNPPHNAPMWRKTLHDEVGLFNSGYRSGGDYELWMRALLKDAKFIKIDEPTAVYYNNPTGISTRQESHGSYEAREIQTIYKTLFERDLFDITPEEFIALARDRFDLSGNVAEIENHPNAWQGKITVLDKYFESKLKQMSQTKFYLPLND